MISVALITILMNGIFSIFTLQSSWYQDLLKTSNFNDKFYSVVEFLADETEMVGSVIDGAGKNSSIDWSKSNKINSSYDNITIKRVKVDHNPCNTTNTVYSLEFRVVDSVLYCNSTELLGGVSFFKVMIGLDSNNDRQTDRFVDIESARTYVALGEVVTSIRYSIIAGIEDTLFPNEKKIQWPYSINEFETIEDTYSQNISFEVALPNIN
ncbi:hypothetical protein [Photobacterium leiognathi]|uniref:hypothetical protein n=1 Tax=Photobacterium leiognathi TaxID=553611 RepID=UPI00387F9EC8